MAAVRACCGCRCPRLYVGTAARGSVLAIRYLSTKTAQSDQEANEELRNEVPKRRRKRDEFTVLKALSSTVQKVPGPSTIGFLNDAYLTPRSDFTRREYIAAMESGRNAAEFIIRKYPDLCNLRDPVPAWPDEFKEFEEKEDEDTLNFHITSEKVNEAVKLYELLQEKGDKISKETVISFLDFVGYYGVGIRDDLVNESHEQLSSSSSDSDSSSEEEEEVAKRGAEKKDDHLHGFQMSNLLLSVHGYATRVFESISEKSAEAYEAYILALLKYGEFTVALRLHDEMRENGFKGSAFLYKAFLDEIDRTKENLSSKERWRLAEDFMHKMKAEKASVPNIGLYNSLLKVASKLGHEAMRRTKMIMREMIANGIEPSLGSYMYVIDGHNQRKHEKLAIFTDAVDRLIDRKEKLEVQDVRDVEFFTSAMNLARGYGNAELAVKLMSLAFRDGNWVFLGTSSSAFLGNYISTLARSEEDIDKVFAEYERLVPNELVPRDWVFAELFKRLEKGERPEKIFKLCDDMKIHRVRLTSPVCDNIFHALASPLPEHLHKQGLDTALEIMKWMSMFEIPVSGNVIGQVARLYSLNGMLNEAWSMIGLFEEKNIKPSSDMMESILDGAAKTQDQRIAMKTARKMAEYGYKLSNTDLDTLCDRLQMNDSERQQIHSLIGETEL